MIKKTYKVQTTKMKSYICIKCLYCEIETGYSDRSGRSIQQLSFWCNHPKYFGVRKYVHRLKKKCNMKQTHTLLEFDKK